MSGAVRELPRHAPEEIIFVIREWMNTIPLFIIPKAGCKTTASAGPNLF